MRSVTLNKIAIKNGDYDILWETFIIGDFHLGDVYSALAQTKYIPAVTRDQITYILRACGLPEKGDDLCYKRVAGTVIGMVHVKKREGWSCE